MLINKQLICSSNQVWENSIQQLLCLRGMAEEALKKIEDQVNCSICLDTYTDPKLLQCSHVYCRQCLVPLVDRDQQGQLGLTCPTCRQVTPISDRGVTGLPPAFHINRLLEIKDSLQKPRRERADSEVAEASAAETTASSGITRHCFEHPGDELKLYCETCEELVCYKCAIRGGKHQSHEYEDLKHAALKYREETTSSLEPLEKHVANAKKTLALIDTRCGEISDQQTTTKGEVHTTFRRLKEVLNARETEIIDQLEQMTQEKLKSLTTQRDQAESTLTQLNSRLHFVREVLRTGSDGEVVLAMRRELATPLQLETSEPKVKADIAFSVSKDIAPECQTLGKLSQGQILEFGAKGDMILPIMVPEYVKYGQLPIARQKRQDGKFGKNFGIPVLTISKVAGPWGVAVNRRKEIFITECDKNCVSVFNPSGKKVRSFGTRGSGQGEFQRPRGIAVDGEGNILVVDSLNYRIQKFTSEGRFLSAVGSKGSGALQFSWPTDIAFNCTNNRVYVVDNDYNCVQILNSDLTSFGSFGTTGNGTGQFCSPLGIACDNSGMVYVADSLNNRIQIFTAEGKFLRMFGNHGIGELKLPYGVAFDTSGIVYVSEHVRQRVSVYTSKGYFMTCFGRKGRGPGKFASPYGLVVDSIGQLYLCDNGNDCVHVF